MFRQSIFPIIFVLTLSLAACSSAIPQTPAAMIVPATATIAAASEPNPYPQTHTDALNRTVIINAKPIRIVSLAPSVTEILFAIGAGSQVVGRTKFCNYPPEVVSLPEIGGFSAKSISVEAILALEPDLVIAGSNSQKDVVAALQDQGLTVFTLAPKSLADIKAGIEVLGEITGNVSGAETVVTDMQARMDNVAEKVSTIPAEKRLHVFYEVGHEPLTTTTSATFIGELLKLAGGINIFDNLEGTYPEVSAEKILELNPQVIIGPSNHTDQFSVAVIGARPGWDKIDAVKSGAIYIVDTDMVSRAGPRVVDALEAISKQLYPELFGN